MGLLEGYKTFVRQNANLVAAVEGGLSNITWLLPDRFSESEALLEAVNAALGVIGLCHERIQATGPGKPSQSPLPWPFWLSLIRQVEVLVELGANNMEKRTQRSKYGPLAGLEALKAMLRLVILYRAGGRILIDGGTYPLEATAKASSTSVVQQRAEAIYSAFSRFRDQHRLPSVPQFRRTSSRTRLNAMTGLGSSSGTGLSAKIGSVGSNLGSISSDMDAPDTPRPRPAPGSETRASSLPDSEGPVASSQPTPEASAPASPIPGSQPLLPEAPPEQDRHSSEKASSSGPGVTVSWGTGPSTEWPSRPRFDRNRPTILPGMLPEDSAVEPEAEGKLTDRSHGSGSGEVYWWSPLERRPSEPDVSAEPAEGDETSKPLDQSETEAAIQREWEAEAATLESRRAHMRRVEACVEARQRLGLDLLVGGELLALLRPLLYVMALRRTGRRSWKPWFLGLGIELGSLQLLSLAARICRAADQQVVADPAMQPSPLPLLYSLQAFRWTALEKQELQRRKALLLWYLIRSPFFEVATRPAVGYALTWLRPVPLVSSIAEKACEILYGIQQYFTYTNAS
ncbi:hypothetical protein WJX74_007731 [Apatococcus lobatus]|uniref:Peroxisomal membrane protein PEX16 n=1 Tax=Apatococcus lobatus TaxID=904363 RepID=A0AAW1QHI8_9CHLO